MKIEPNQKEYIYGLDFLRGLCALLVATYHMLGWENIIDFTAIGYYGVYIFFILSGFAIHYQYSNKLKLLDDLKGFYTLRVARLMPLLFVVVLYQYKDASFFSFPYYYAILTLSLFFGFGMPGTTSAVTGGWSLGIEFGFYIMYPFLMNLLKNWRVFLIFFVFFFILRFSFVKITYFAFQDYFWFGYTQILPFIFFFFAGMGLAKFYLENDLKNQKRYFKILGFSAILILFFLFSYRDLAHQHILDGVRGMFLSMYSVLIVFMFSFLNTENFYIKYIYRFFGNISYGVYLIHPVVYTEVKHLQLVPMLKISMVLIASIVLAYFIKVFFEDPIRSFIKKSNFFVSKIEEVRVV